MAELTVWVSHCCTRVEITAQTSPPLSGVPCSQCQMIIPMWSSLQKVLRDAGWTLQALQRHTGAEQRAYISPPLSPPL